MLSVTQRGRDDGPPILFLHAGGISSWMWHAVVAHLPNHSCHLVDLPGHGRSSDVPWRSIGATADLVAQAAAEAKAGAPWHLVGLSLGGYVGLEALVRHPDVFETAILSGIHDGGMPRQWLMKPMMAVMAPFATRPYLARKTARMMVDDGPEIEDFVREAGRTNATALRRALIDVIKFEPPTGLDRIMTRTLIATGEREAPLILEARERLAAAIPDGRALAVPGGNHGWPGKFPKLCAEIIDAHIGGRALPMEAAA